jgi:hypothetical protein
VAAVRDGSQEAIGAWLVERSKQWDAFRPYTVAAFEAAAVDPELRGLVDQWIEEVASDIEAGLDDAGRFDPATGTASGGRRTASTSGPVTSWRSRLRRTRVRRCSWATAWAASPA